MRREHAEEAADQFIDRYLGLAPGTGRGAERTRRELVELYMGYRSPLARALDHFVHRFLLFVFFIAAVLVGVGFVAFGFQPPPTPCADRGVHHDPDVADGVPEVLER